MPTRKNPTDEARSGRLPAALAWVVALVASLAVVSVLVVTTSIAAFTDTTQNTGNSFATGTISLTDDAPPATAMFSVSGLIPGQSVTDCIQVTYSGDIADPSGVKLYSGGYTDSGDLATYLNVTIEEGTGATFGSCGGFSLENTIETGGTLWDFNNDHTNYTNGAGVWDPASTPVSKSYRITIDLDSAAPDTEQGESVTAMAFTWEVQS